MSFVIEEVLHTPRSGRPWRRVFARIGGRRFEFTIYLYGDKLEVYDYPRSWNGLARFLGYAPDGAREMLDAIVQRHEGR